MQSNIPGDAGAFPLSQPPISSLPVSKPKPETVISKWKKQHKIEKHKGTDPLVKVGHKVGLGAAVVLSPLVVVPGAVLYAKEAIKEKYKVTYKPNSLMPAIRKMKTTEETDKLATMKAVASEFNVKLTQERFASEVLGEIQQQESFNPEWIKILNDPHVIYNDPKDIRGKIKQFYPNFTDFGKDLDAIKVKKVGETFKKSNIGGEDLTGGIKVKLNDSKLAQERLAREFLRELARQESFNPEWIKILNDPRVIYNDPKDIRGKIKQFYSNFTDVDKNLNAIQVKKQKYDKREIDSQKQDAEIQKFEASLNKLLKIMCDQRTNQDPTSQNRELIAALRGALKSPVYQALKYDASQPAVQFLHRLAVDTWNKAPSMNAYKAVGDSIKENLNIYAKDYKKPQTASQYQHQQFRVSTEQMANLLEKSHDRMIKKHFENDTMLGNLKYAVTHPTQTLGGLASEGGPARHIPAMVGRDEYDSHGTLSNNPSLQGVTNLEFKMNGKDQKATVHNCYGGSPTIGDHEISPEFEAMIQAAENNQFLPQDKRDPNMTDIVVYNNLQNLDKEHGEGPRSRVIMLLNQKYPLSFRGTTLSKDSSFYLMKDGTETWTNAQDFGKEMKAQLMRSFDPEESNHGFYFHGSPDKWEKAFDKIIANANYHFSAMTGSPKELRGAYQEYFYSMLNSYIELDSIKTLIARGVENPKVTVISACKENIDRGGMENTKYLYNKLFNNKDNLSLQEEEDRLSLILGIMHSRALSTRDRVIMASRLPQVLSYIKTTSPREFRANQEKLFNDILDCDVTKNEYNPFLT